MRRSLPLLNKVAKAVGLLPEELEAALVGWPSADQVGCWRGRPKVFHTGKPRQTLRLCYELATGEALPEGVRLREKLCPNAGCLNPHHYRVRAYVGWRERVGLVSRDLATTAAVLTPSAEFLAEDEEADVADLLDMISSGDGGRHRSAESLHDQWPMYDVGLIQIALERLRAEEL